MTSLNAARLHFASAAHQAKVAYFPKDAIGRDVGPERAEAAVRCFAKIWEHSLFDCDAQDYETMTTDILHIMGIPHA